jgi:hypothetical protein
MRFLKNKIMRAAEAQQKRLDTEPLQKLEDQPELVKVVIPIKVQTNLPKLKAKAKGPAVKKRRNPSSTKNLVINYGKAIASFAVSDLAIPYLEPFLETENVSLQEFISFINQSKKNIGGIKSFKYLILTTSDDSEMVAIYKKIFRDIAAVFINYFSVNWIMHGKVTHKKTYLFYRFKMLRRIQDPENFTYMKQRVYNKKK